MDRDDVGKDGTLYPSEVFGDILYGQWGPSADDHTMSLRDALNRITGLEPEPRRSLVAMFTSKSKGVVFSTSEALRPSVTTDMHMQLRVGH